MTSVERPRALDRSGFRFRRDSFPERMMLDGDGFAYCCCAEMWPRLISDERGSLFEFTYPLNRQSDLRAWF